MEEAVQTVIAGRTFRKCRRKVQCLGVSVNNFNFLCYGALLFYFALCSILIGTTESADAVTEVTAKPITVTLVDFVALTKQATPARSRDALKPHQRTLYPAVKYAGLAGDLRAQPIIAPEAPGELQLNVSWLPPKGRRPDDYSIEVLPLKGSGCESKLCYEYNINGSSTWKLVPGYISSVEGAECSIKPGCSYSVQLTSHPWNGKDSILTQITVPDCVENVCSCRHASSMLAPFIRAVVLNNTVNVTWGYDSAMSEEASKISQYLLSFGEQRVQTKYSKPWFSHDQVYRIPVRAGRAMFSKELKAETIPGKLYLIRVQGYSIQGCPGPVGNLTLKVPEPPAKRTLGPYEIVIICISLPLVCFLLVYLAGGWGLPCRIKRLLEVRALARTGSTNALHRQPAWPPVFLNGTE